MKPAYYNEIDPYCVRVLKARIADGSLPLGDVDTRDIREVSGDELKGYGQIHLFAGIGGFGYAARLAGLPDGLDILTGGFPCQPWSVAGDRGGASDDRHLWPEMLRIISDAKPQRVLGENVPGLDDKAYMALDGVLSDLEGAGYAAQPLEVPACAVNAPHIRNRVWILAFANSERRTSQRRQCSYAAKQGSFWRDHGRSSAGDAKWQKPACVAGEDSSGLADSSGTGLQRLCGASRRGEEDTHDGISSWWESEPAVDRVANGVSHRVDRVRSLGNAIVPQVAAQIMEAME